MQSMKRRVVVVLSAATLGTHGCHEIANPLVDDLAPTDTITTPSAAGVESADAPQAVHTRAFDRQPVEPTVGTVTHWPLWYQDPFEDKGSEDGQFRLTEEDGIALPYGLARFILNTMGLPVSIGVQPPWKLMCSDGRLSRQALGYDHDPERCVGGAPTPIDVLEIGTIDGAASEPAEPAPPPAGP